MLHYTHMCLNQLLFAKRQKGICRVYVGSASTQWIARSEEHTSELQSHVRISYAVFCFQKKNTSPHLFHSLPYFLLIPSFFYSFPSLSLLLLLSLFPFFFFFKQKTAYELLTCDWSSDVCSSDLVKS